MYLFHVFVIFSYFARSVHNENILAIFPTPTKSHFVMFQQILKALATKGHNVDVVSFFPLKQPLKGYNDLVDLTGSQPSFVNNVTVEYVRNMTYYDLMQDMLIYTGTDACKATFELPEIIELKNTKKKYKLLITELFCTDCMLGFGHHFKIPTVLMTSSVNLPWANDRFGNPDNPSYIPNYFVDYTTNMTLYQRIINTVTLLGHKIVYSFMSGRESNRLAKQFFGNNMPDLEELAYNTNLILVNSHFSVNFARPTVPNVIEVGGAHITEPKRLSRSFTELLATGSEGIIYLSMGSMITTESFPKEKLQAMFDGFSELNYKIIWKANRTRFPEGLRYPRNIVFKPWMPQLDILCHPRVKLFVSHGGLMGTQESVYCGVPILGIPLFADQDLNVRQFEEMGLAVKVAYDDISKDNIKNASLKVLNNQRYKRRSEKISKAFKDRPMSALDTSVYWIEYVLRHNGANHLKSYGRNLYWYQYHLLDVIFILLSILFIIIYIFAKIIKYSTPLLFKKKEKIKKS